VLTRSDILGGLTDKEGETAAKDAMQKRFETAHPTEMLDSVLARMIDCQCHTIPVLRDGYRFSLPIGGWTVIRQNRTCTLAFST